VIDERIASRRADVRTARRRARLRRTLLALAGIAVVAGLVWLEGSEWVAIDRITVVGTQRLDPSEVLAVSELEIGAPALRVRPGATARRIEDLVIVRHASVRRERIVGLVLDVTERQPVYVVVFGPTELLVDRDGVVIDEGRIPGLPVVRLTTRPPSVGGLVVSNAALANAHQVWTALSGPLRAQVVELRAPDEDGLELVLTSGVAVRFGRAERLEDKIRSIGVVLDDIAGTEVTFIDVRVPRFPAVGFD
jgi:cell division protein FtsQ